MADSFQPRFVDLVRNYTTTSGTANFVLGAAVSGFNSFVSALQVGDRFYYSAIGVDRPNEREVGRGTLQANGVISREPVSGSKTNFSTGTKTIALIAAAEWFNNVQAGAGNSDGGSAAGAIMVATKAELAALSGTQSAALLTEHGCEGLFIFDAADLSDEVSADPRQGIYVAPATAASGASGAWVRQFVGLKAASWFGVKGDGVTDDHTALQAWLDSGGNLLLGEGEHYSSATLILRRNAVIQGEGYGFDGRLADGQPRTLADMPGSRIRFAPGVGGIDIQPQQSETSVTAVLAAADHLLIQEGAMHSRISNMALIGGGGASATGLKSRTVVHLDNVHVLQFAGKGFDIVATSDLEDGHEYGNASGSSIRNCYSKHNGSHGFHIRGRDANTILLDNNFAQVNDGWGFLEDGLLGNLYLKNHAATNTAGAFKSIGAVNGSYFVGNYVEAGAGSNAEVDERNTIIGGVGINAPPNVDPLTVGYGQTVLHQPKFVHHFAAGAITGCGYVFHNNDSGLNLHGEGSNSDVSLVNKAGTVAAYVPTGTVNLMVGGLLGAATVAANAGLRTYGGHADGNFTGQSINLGYGGAPSYQHRIGTRHHSLQQAGNAIDFYVWKQGTDTESAPGTELVLSLDKSGSGLLSNLLVTGNVSAIGSMLSSHARAGVGYATGAGGAVTQGTSKSTGVTLNKACGSITMHNAALPANTTISFTVTNSAVAATDVVSVSIKSGNATAGSYQVWTEATGAGSFKINVRNISGGSLSEAVVLNFAVLKAVVA